METLERVLLVGFWKAFLALLFFLVLFGSFAASAASVCSNGIIEAGEQCDDGNLIDGDGCSSSCQLEPQCMNTWEKNFAAFTQLTSVKETFDSLGKSSGYIAVGQSNLGGVYLSKLDTLGEPQWNSQISALFDSRANSVGQTADGGYIVAGYAQNFGGPKDFVLVKTDSQGMTCPEFVGNCDGVGAGGVGVFIRVFPASGEDIAYSVVAASDGYIVAGETSSFIGGQNFWVIKTNLAGNTCLYGSSGNCTGAGVFAKTFDGGGSEIARQAIKTSDGGYAVVGTRQLASSDFDMWVVKMDSAGQTCTINVGSGECSDSFEPAKKFVEVIGRTGNSQYNDFAGSIGQTLDGGYVLVGNTYSFTTGPSDSDLWVVKTDDRGKTCDFSIGGACHESSLRFVSRFGETKIDLGNSVKQTKSGDYIIAGKKQLLQTPVPSYLWLMKLNSLGNPLFDKTFGQTVSNGLSIEEVSDGGIIIGGITNPNSGYLVKTGPGGEINAPCCGNGVKWYPEECDDGNLNSGDGCSAACLVERCGNGRVDSGEVCDDGNIVSGDGCKGDCSGFNSPGACSVGNESAQSVDVVTESGKQGYVLAGSTGSFGGGTDLWVVKADERGKTCDYSLTSGSCLDSNGPQVKFATKLGDSGAFMDAGNSVVKVNDGSGYVVAGSYGNSAAEGDLWLLKLNALGALVPAWNLKLNFNSTSDDGGNAVIETFSNSSKTTSTGFAASGFTRPGASGWTEAFLVRVDGGGAVQSKGFFNVASNNYGSAGLDQNFSPSTGAATGFTFAGTASNAPNPDTSFYLTSVKPNGTTSSWQVANQAAAFTEFGQGVKQLSGRLGFIGVGSTSTFGVGLPASSKFDLWLVKTNNSGTVGCTYNSAAADGNCFNAGGGVTPPTFARTFGSGGNDYGYSVAETPDLGFVTAGAFDAGANNGEFWVVKTDSSGVTCNFGASACSSPPSKFTTIVSDGPGNAVAFSVKLTPIDGGYVAVGSTDGYGSGGDAWLVKMDSTGATCTPDATGNCEDPVNPTQKFIRRFSGPACNSCGNSIVEASNNEECDLGAANINTGLCNTSCKVTRCGDKIVQVLDGNGFAEQCDDGRKCSDGTDCTDNPSLCSSIGDLKCLPRSGGGCDNKCQLEFSGVKILDLVLEPLVFGVGDKASQFKAVVYSTELGVANIVVTVRDASSGQILYVLSPAFNYNLVLGTQTIDLVGNPDFSAIGLKSGSSYKAVAEVTVSVGNYKDSKSVFFTVSSTKIDAVKVAAVPEIDSVLVPLVAFAVLGLVFWKSNA